MGDKSTSLIDVRFWIKTEPNNAADTATIISSKTIEAIKNIHKL
jgi:hypothetical protein